MMGKILNILKKYKLFVAIIIFLIILLIILLVQKDGDTITGTLQIKKIQSPYEIAEYETKIELQGNSITIPKKDRIFKVNSYNTELFISFVKKFTKISEETDFSESVVIQKDNEVFAYFPYEGTLMITSSRSLGSEYIIRTEEDVKTFFSRHLGITDLVFTEVSEESGWYEYKGRYVLEGLEVGALSLDGDAFSLRTDKNGYIYKLQMLLLSEENIEQYQTMPLSNIKDLIISKKYPKAIRHIEAEERYFSQPFSYRLAEFFVREIELLYIFNDSSNGYILPTYRLSGDGRLVSERDDGVWSKTHMYICAIDPSYLIQKPKTPKEAIIDQPSPYIRP